MWEGEAQQTFKVQFGNDRASFEAMSNILKEYVAILNKNIQTYHGGEQGAIEIIKKRRI